MEFIILALVIVVMTVAMLVKREPKQGSNLLIEAGQKPQPQKKLERWMVESVQDAIYESLIRTLGKFSCYDCPMKQYIPGFIGKKWHKKRLVNLIIRDHLKFGVVRSFSLNNFVLIIRERLKDSSKDGFQKCWLSDAKMVEMVLEEVWEECQKKKRWKLCVW